jgi:hypothetical protein
MGAALFVIAFVLCCNHTVAAQGDAAFQQRRSDLEIQKLELEVKRLEQESVLQQRKGELDTQKLQAEVQKLRLEIRWWWLSSGPLGFVGGIVAALAAVFVAWLARRGGLTQATHQKRLESYPKLVAATAPFAIYFPGDTPAPRRFDTKAIGQALSKWYFEEGGLLMSKDARNAYFRFARALTRASCAKQLKIDHTPPAVSEQILRRYRNVLSESYKLDLWSPTSYEVESWPFGSNNEPSNCEPGLRCRFKIFLQKWRRKFYGDRTWDTDLAIAKNIKDYVFLQQLSSLLRTSLTDDILSRRRPT